MNDERINIKIEREKAGLTQQQLAEKAGLSESSIRRYENGIRRPGEPELQAIGDALGISIQLFFGEAAEDNPAPDEAASAETCPDFGTNLRKAREAKGMTQFKLASLTGISPDGISRYELGYVKTPNPENVRKLADALEVPVAALIPGRGAAEAEYSGDVDAATRPDCKACHTSLKFGPSFAENVRMARENAGMTQTELAVHAGVSTDTIQRFESGKTKQPMLRTLLRLSAVLNVPIRDLAPGAEDFYRLGDVDSVIEIRKPRNKFGEAFGKNLRKFREAAGLTLPELAERAKTSPETLRKYESGQAQKPCLVRVQCLATALGVTIQELAPGYESLPRCVLPPNVTLMEIPEETMPQTESAQPQADGHQWISLKAPDGTQAKYFSGPLSEMLREMPQEDIKSVADYAKFILGDTAVMTDMPGQWLSLTAPDGTETAYFSGPLGELLYGAAPEDVRQVASYALFIRQRSAA